MIKSFKVGCSRTINLGNFESIRVEAQIEIEVEPEASENTSVWQAHRISAQTELRSLLEDTYKAQHKLKS